MHIKHLQLFTHKLKENERFYRDVLGFSITGSAEDAFTVKIGSSTLTFTASAKKYVYHYCFLIPKNKLSEALVWLGEKLDLIPIAPGKFTQRFESWNADSCYFYDGSGNIAEFIVRHDLPYETEAAFDADQIISVNEIGMPTRNSTTLVKQLKQQMNCPIWKGNSATFCVCGSQKGLFLVPNYTVKKNWFPTELPTKPAPFTAVVRQEEQYYRVTFCDENLDISKP